MGLLVQAGLVALGSSLGGLLRWGVGVAASRRLGTLFPYGTFLINVSGSLVLGWFMAALPRLAPGEGAWMGAEDLRLLVAVGFTGGYTTFSTFEYETHGLLRDGDGLLGVTYLAGSVFLGLLAVRLGIRLGQP